MKSNALFIWLLSCCVMPAWAQRFQTGETVTISQPVNGDLYVTGGTVTINAPIRGDLIAAGGTITINDSVTSDILLAGSEVTLNGFVGDDIRCVAGTIRLERAVAGDAIMAGSEITTEPLAAISGGLLAAAGKLKLNSSVGRDARIAFGDLWFTGKVGGVFQCQGGKAHLNGQIRKKATLAANELSIGPNALFAKEVRYWSQAGQVAFGSSVSVGRPIFDNTLNPNAQRKGSGFGLWGALIYLGMIVCLIVLINFLLTNYVKQAAYSAATNTLSAIGMGFLFFLGMPVVMVIAFVTIIGIPVGVLLTFAYIAAMMVAPAMTAVVLTGIIRNRSTDPAWSGRRFLLTALGVGLILQLLWAVPFLGWMIHAGLICLAVGALLLQIRPRKAAPIGPRQLEPTFG